MKNKDKNKRDIKFHLPKQLLSVLESELRNNPPIFTAHKKYDDLIFKCILHDLLVAPYAYPSLIDEEKPGYMPLSSGFLQKKYGKEYSHYIKYLELYTQIIICEGGYTIGKKCKIYKINEKFNPKDDKTSEVIIPYKSSIWKYIHNYHKKQKKTFDKQPRHVKIMQNYFIKNFRINEAEAIKYMIKHETEDIQGKIAFIKQINGGAKNMGLFFKRNQTNNRIDSNLTYLPKELCKFVISDEQLIQIDKTNSQAFYLNLPLKRIMMKGTNISSIYNTIYNNIYNKSSPTICTNIVENAIQSIGITDVYADREITEEMIREFDSFLSITADGSWYEILAHILKTDRDAAKDEWMYFAYGRNGLKPYLKSKLSAIYPTVVDIIRSYKLIRYQDFSNFLTTIESTVVLDHICKRLVEEGIIPYTKHDCFIVPKSKVARTKEIINEVNIEIIGAAPKTKEKSFNRLSESDEESSYYDQMTESERTGRYNNKSKNVNAVEVIGDDNGDENIMNMMIRFSNEANKAIGFKPTLKTIKLKLPPIVEDGLESQERA